MDLIPVIPLQFIHIAGEERNFYLIKIIRIFIGIDFLNPGAIAEYITYFNIYIRIKKMIENDLFAAESQDVDRTYIHLIMFIKYCLSISKLVFIIMTICYFLGCFWHFLAFEIYLQTREHNATLDPAV